MSKKKSRAWFVSPQWAELISKHYADDAEANADRRADELETEGDQPGAAIWRRVTVAIEQLTDRTGTLH